MLHAAFEVRLTVGRCARALRQVRRTLFYVRFVLCAQQGTPCFDVACLNSSILAQWVVADARLGGIKASLAAGLKGDGLAFFKSGETDHDD